MIHNVKIKNIFNYNWANIICEKYKGISKTDRKIFWILFVSVNLMFIFHTISFLWGADDWSFVVRYATLTSDNFEGRYCGNILKCLLLQGQILPIVNTAFAFFGLVIGIIYLFKYWELDNKIKYFVTAGLIFICSPFTNAWLLYIYCIIEHFWGILFIVLGLEFAIKYKTKDKTSFYISNAISVLFLLLSISIYQPCISTILIVLFAKLFIKSVEGKYKEMFFILKHSLLNILISSLLYLIIYKICLVLNLICTFLPNQQLIHSYSELLKNISTALNAIYTSIFSYERILMPKIITKLYLVIMVFAIATCMIKIIMDEKSIQKNFGAFIKSVFCKLSLSIFIFVLLLFSTQISLIVTCVDGISTEARIVFYGMLFLWIFMLVLIFKYANVYLKNITYIICLILLMEYTTVNFVSQKSFKLANMSELLKMDRVVNLIEQCPNLTLNKDYHMIVVGNMSSSRPIYVGKFTGQASSDLANTPLIPYHSIPHPLSYINDGIKYDKMIFLNLSYENLFDNIEQVNVLKKHIKELKPYPNKNSVIIDGDYLIIVLDKESLGLLKSRLDKSYQNSNLNF